MTTLLFWCSSPYWRWRHNGGWVIVPLGTCFHITIRLGWDILVREDALFSLKGLDLCNMVNFVHTSTINPFSTNAQKVLPKLTITPRPRITTNIACSIAQSATSPRFSVGPIAYIKRVFEGSSVPFAYSANAFDGQLLPWVSLNCDDVPLPTSAPTWPSASTS